MRRRRTKGAALTETAAGLILLIPVALFLLDVAALVIAQVSNDALAKHAARAAAEMPTGAGQPAATNVIANYASGAPTLCQGAKLLTYLDSGTTVTVTTQITCVLPCPIPLGGPQSQVFCAQATEPIVGNPP